MTATAPDTWDVVVIGGGPVGENAAEYAVQGGLSAVIVEAELLGGECSYWACMPSKALLHPVEIVHTTHHLRGVVPTTVDVRGALDRRDAFTHGLDDSRQVAWAAGEGIDFVRGRARLTGEKTVVVATPDGEQRTIHARHAVVLATGSTPTIPPVHGLREARPWTSRDVTNLHEVPRRVLVIGGGVVATESATWLAGLGCEQVTILERGPALLARNEPFAGQMVRRSLEQAGVDVRIGATLERVGSGPVRRDEVGFLRGREVTATVDGEAIVVDEVVVAAGRRPNTLDVGLDVVGLDPAQAPEVDDHMTVTAVAGDWLYAVGDVNGRALLTHQGKYQARVCGDVIVARAAGRPLDDERFVALADHGAVPQVCFTDPPVAAAGVTEQQARDAGADVRAVEIDLAAVAGASLVRDDYVGRAKLVIDQSSRLLLGATFVGTETPELLHSATVAIVGKVPVERLWHAVPSYPTVSEGWLRLLEALREAERAEAIRG
jgi:pyruvate/2-oxoglutarate dehydrogenase complex dihydrolipoamide dehydrogenase (E3) component